MHISSLKVNDVRILEYAHLQPSPVLNLITGHNGSGKTSILESLYLLSHGRSFRTSKVKGIIRSTDQAGSHAPECTVFANVEMPHLQSVPVGIQRALDGSIEAKIAGENIKRISDLSALLPVQLIAPDTFELISGSPSLRRQFLDWGVFHVEHSFIEQWRNFNKSLKQRNRLLRSGNVDATMLSIWDREFIKFGELVHQFRQKYFEEFVSTVGEFLDILLPGLPIKIDYYPGWDRKLSLGEVLQKVTQRDTDLGYTSHGPQRADLRVKYKGLSADQTLSRGQQKLLVCALKIAQTKLFRVHTKSNTIFLLDDLAAELDQFNKEKVINLLLDQSCQMFITGLNAQEYDFVLNKQAESAKQKAEDLASTVKMFHVEHGEVKALDVENLASPSPV